MKKAFNNLTNEICNSATIAGLLADGGGLYLKVTATSKSWCFRYSTLGRKREMGLGGLRKTSLEAARADARWAAAELEAGRDPIEERRRHTIPTFYKCFDEFRKAKLRRGATKKVQGDWKKMISTFAAHLYPMPISEIMPSDIKFVLQGAKGSRTQQLLLNKRMSLIFSYAGSRGWCDSKIDEAFTRFTPDKTYTYKPKISPRERNELHYDEIPALMSCLRKRQAIAARALEFQILTAAMPHWIQVARWHEVDMDERVWKITWSDRYGMAFTRELSTDALNVLTSIPQNVGFTPIFTALNPRRSISLSAMESMMERLNYHSNAYKYFSDAFDRWAYMHTNCDDTIFSEAFYNSIPSGLHSRNHSEYVRTIRRELLGAWAKFCATGNHVSYTLPSR